MSDEEEIRTSVNEAWDWFHHNHAAYLQALVYVLEARGLAFTNPDLEKAHEKLGTLTCPLPAVPAEWK
jgi:hypothetical protein